ncbi:MAG: hypothetical protein NZ480_08405 [Bdellovibrionaceae bacterium]|nr:hypothetical protein [Pseudobdellovibrionaceae bacterium]MDW8190358.1 hypothetical protein [Pseudobdellovibrionaceae bacterium]
MEENKKKRLAEQFQTKILEDVAQDIHATHLLSDNDNLIPKEIKNLEEPSGIAPPTVKTDLDLRSVPSIFSENNQKTEIVPNKLTTNEQQSQQSQHSFEYKEEKEKSYSSVILKIDNNIEFAHHLKLAQNKIIELEKELDRLREENELLTVAAQTHKNQAEEYFLKLNQLENEKREALEQAQMEIMVVQQNLKRKEHENKKLVDELTQLRLEIQHQVKNVRKRERDLENRLEILKQERNALLKAKDEMILQLRQRIDEMNGEIELMKEQNQQLNKKIAGLQDQIFRTVKTLRLTLNHLQSEEEVAPPAVPIKKAK